MRFSMFIFFLFSSSFLSAQEKAPRLQYNIIVKSEPKEVNINTLYEIENLDDESKSKSLESIQELTAFLFSDLAKLPKQKRQVLFYVHGMWGGKKFAFDRTYKMIENLYLDNPNSDIGRIVSIKWPGNKMEYKVNKKKLYAIDHDVTNTFLEFFNSYYTFRFLNRLNDVNLDMIAHSLGTELIKEVICQLPSENFNEPILDQLILASPDLDTDVFEKETCFGRQLKMINQTTVYFSDRDLTLNVSNNLNDLDRLGRAGPTEDSSIPDNVTFIEVTDIKDETNFGDLMTGHSSFRASPVIAKDILSVLTCNHKLRYANRVSTNKNQNIFKLELPSEKGT